MGTSRDTSSLTDDDRSQVVDGNVKGKPLLTVAHGRYYDG